MTFKSAIGIHIDIINQIVKRFGYTLKNKFLKK